MSGLAPSTEREGSGGGGRGRGGNETGSRGVIVVQGKRRYVKILIVGVSWSILDRTDFHPRPAE